MRRRLFKEAVEDEHQCLTEARDMSTRCPFRDTNSIKVADGDLNTMMIETTDETLMPSSLPCLPCCTKKFSANNIPLSSSVRLSESRDVRFVPTTCAQNLREREGTGLQTVIIMRIKRALELCEELCESQLDRESSQSDKAAVIFIGDEGHLKCEKSPVDYNNWSFCSTLHPVFPSGSRH